MGYGDISKKKSKYQIPILALTHFFDRVIHVSNVNIFILIGTNIFDTEIDRKIWDMWIISKKKL